MMSMTILLLAKNVQNIIVFHHIIKHESSIDLEDL